MTFFRQTHQTKFFSYKFALTSAIVALLLFSLLINVGAQSQTEIPGRALATINMRATPSEVGAIITRIPFETELTIEARNQFGNWLLVRLADNTRGWAASRYIGWSEEIELANIVVSFEIFSDVVETTPVPGSAAASAPVATITALNIPEGEPGSALARLNVRQGPGFQYAVVGLLAYRTTLVIEARNTFGDWLLVQSLEDATRGWVASRYVSWRQERELATFPVSDEVFGEAANISGVPGVHNGVPASETIIAPEGTTPGRVLVDRLNIRAGAGLTFGSLAQLSLDERVLIEARSPRGDWLLIRTLNDEMRGWVASRFIGWSEEIDLVTFVVSDEVISSGMTPTPTSIPAPTATATTGS